MRLLDVKVCDHAPLTVVVNLDLDSPLRTQSRLGTIGRNHQSRLQLRAIGERKHDCRFRPFGAQAFNAFQKHQIWLPTERFGQRLLKIGFLGDRRKLEDATAIGAEFELRVAVIAEDKHFLHRRNALVRKPWQYAPALQTTHTARIKRIDPRV